MCGIELDNIIDIKLNRRTKHKCFNKKQRKTVSLKIIVD